MYSLHVLDTPPDLPFDRITSLASRLFKVPIALVSLVDAHRQWFKSRYGLEASETPRHCSFCAYAVLEDAPDIFVVLDSLKDPRFRENPLVLGPPFVRFYAGAALNYTDDVKLGTLCLIDTVPREHFTLEEKMQLMDLASVVVTQLKFLMVQEQSRMTYITATTHNLRTPLFCLELCMNNLKSTLSQNDSEAFNQAISNIDIMKWTVEKAVTAARSHSLGSSPAPTVGVLAVQEIINRVRTAMIPLLRSVPITFTLNPTCPPFLGTDEGLLWHILVDLLTNACQWTDEGSIEVKFSVSGWKDQVQLIKVEVKDTGCGIHQNIRSRLFQEPFVNTGKSGFGLGCYNVRKNISMLGGSCGFVDNVPKGSVFWIEFPNIPSVHDLQPMKQVATSGSPAKRPASQAATPPPLMPSSHKLLVIDDCMTIRKMTQRLLQKLGHENVDIAENGKDGLELLKKSSYSLVFCDFLMPVMNGVECVRAYREWEKGQPDLAKRTVIVGMSANAEPNDVQNAQNNGMDEFCVKPITLSKLKEVIERMLGKL
uniref:Histidine kinase n=1 Tax=Arcella intermedia TaxID=1963864 RepID=A0A6B2L196_9EUKA